MRGAGTEKALQCGKLSRCFCVTDLQVAGGVGELSLMGKNFEEVSVSQFNIPTYVFFRYVFVKQEH